ncbi:MAG: RidA family protein [Verrucomicrobia bacterium]|nr:RidA family protein [Verrucomicrobiota bacterium]
MNTSMNTREPTRAVPGSRQLGSAAKFASMVLGLFSISFAQSGTNRSEVIKRLAKIDHPGSSWAVRAADAPLMFTGQIMAPDAASDARGQAERALDRLGVVLNSAGGDISRVLRLNAYVAEDKDTPAIEAVVAARFAGAPPVVTLVRSSLIVKDARVAFDAVALISRAPTDVEIASGNAVMPAGAKVFLSGVSGRVSDLPTSVQETMEKLSAISGHLGLGKRDVVQVKIFLQPFSEFEAARREIARIFSGGPVPPIVMVEWLSTAYTEIEMVLSGRALKPQPQAALTFPTIPGRTLSPVYSHVATVAAGTPLIFLGGIDAGHSGPPREQLKRVFEKLGSMLFEADSSYRQLVKATYYVADATTRMTLNEIRPVYYDPARPPAATAVVVSSVGRSDRACVIDMIAVPRVGPK